MEPLHISINVTGSWCNEWPKLKLSFNDRIYFDGFVEGNKCIEFDVEATDVNRLVITHYEKSFGANNRWDTEVKDNIIVKDRAIKINDLEFNNVSISRFIIQHWPFITDDNETLYTTYLGHNGNLTIDFKSPVYNWIIGELIRNLPKGPQPAIVAETSHNDLFNYDQDQVGLLEIEELLKKYAHLLN